jgi:hypothetical protein
VAGSRPTLVAVKGKITLKGQPLTKGIVRFEPDGYGRMATGEVQSDGSFVLGTYEKGDGAVVGQHRVFVTDTGASPRKELVPEKYTVPTTSKLTAAVDPEHADFTFDLK